MKKIITKNEKETFNLACDLGRKIKEKTIFALKGDLGTGKTIFAKGIALGLGIKKTITSPTFVLMKIYPIEGNKYINEFCHIDTYRLKGEKDLEAIGAREYLDKKDVVVVIEWPDKIKKLLPRDTKLVKLKYLTEEKRQIEIK